MATYAQPIIGTFGPTLANLGSAVGYVVRDPVTPATVHIARTTSASGPGAPVAERLDQGGAHTGVYVAVPTLDTTWGTVEVAWDITGAAYAGYMVADFISPASASSDPWGGVLAADAAAKLLRDQAAVLLGNTVEPSDHSTTTFADADSPSTTRVTSTNTSTARTVTRH